MGRASLASNGPWQTLAGFAGFSVTDEQRPVTIECNGDAFKAQGYSSAGTDRAWGPDGAKWPPGATTRTTVPTKCIPQMCRKYAELATCQPSDLDLHFVGHASSALTGPSKV